jgi:hypothetical protein
MKPTHAKPQLYAYYFLTLKEIAKEYGYNLLVHGSMNRDLDLIAIPWVDEPKPETEMIQALCDHMGGKLLKADSGSDVYKKLPGGRSVYVINLNRGGYAKNDAGEITEPLEYTPDPEYYIDISVTPYQPKPAM